MLAAFRSCHILSTSCNSVRCMLRSTLHESYVRPSCARKLRPGLGFGHWCGGTATCGASAGRGLRVRSFAGCREAGVRVHFPPIVVPVRPLAETCCPFCAVQAATSAPLIERSIERATGIVYNITGGRDLTLQEVNRCAALPLRQSEGGEGRGEGRDDPATHLIIFFMGSV